MVADSHGTDAIGSDHTPEVEVPDERRATVGYNNHGWFVIHEDANPGGWIAFKEREVYR